MFEGKPPVPGLAEDIDAAAKAGEELRALSWDEIVARLGAARELSKVLSQSHEDSPSDSPQASFDAGSARHLAAICDEEKSKFPKSVNPSDLGNRKEARGTSGAQQEQRRLATRGNT